MILKYLKYFQKDCKKNQKNIAEANKFTDYYWLFPEIEMFNKNYTYFTQ